ncbi:ATP-dependent RNA helicase ddx24 [Anopheles marshallii]|uniref:ATP-dependent RNA helicase ddx24 n=1 Tax=Anopheles marshallii TaxID=1521116 RepID=UPI00237AE76D|nr:ATP-dependent RNA helicase ddx24 [Anopheles marshallii]
MQKQRKFNPKKGPHKYLGRKKPQSSAWQPVKLNGPVIADEGADFDGFVGLEILENYSGDFLRKEKNKNKEETEVVGKRKKSKRKHSSDSDDESDSEEEEVRVKSKKKQKKAKSAKPDTEDSSEDDSGFDDQPKKKIKATHERLITKTSMSGNDSDKNREVDTVPAFSMLLKPPTSKQTQQKVKDTANDSAITISSNDSNSKKQATKSKQNVTAKGPTKTNAKPAKMTQKRVKESNTKADKSEPEPHSSADYAAWVQLGVSEPIVRALADKGFKVPTEIQTQSLPVAIYGRRDLLGAAETGSGKTLAFGIPMLEGIMAMKRAKQQHADNSSEHEMTPPPEDMDITEEDEQVFAKEGRALEKNCVQDDTDKPLYGLILTPTRELAVQINDHLKAVAKYTGINIATIFGGLAAVKQERLLRKCPEIVIATPGRLWELIQSDNHHLSKVEDIRFLVIDETDRMLEKGHFEELKQLLELINANEDAKKLRRNYIFSATLTMDHEMPDHLKKNVKKSKKVYKLTPGQRMDNLIEVIGMTNPKIVDLTQDHGTARTLTESRILCQAEQKDFYLYYFLERHPGRTLVFCNSIDCVKRLVSLFDYLDCQPFSLFGSMQQRQRLKNLERFTANPRALLIATDVAARGLDIPNVDHVIHYQVPKTTENYVHRSGRTARASKEGLTVLLIAPGEVKNYVKLNQDLGRTDDLPLYPTYERVMRQVKERVLLARDIERMDLQQRREGATRSWEDQLAKEFQSESEVDSEQEEVRRFEETKRKRQFRAKRLELSQLLAKPIVDIKIEMNYPSLNIDAMKSQPSEKNQSAISLVRKAEEQRILEKKQRRNRKKY